MSQLDSIVDQLRAQVKAEILDAYNRGFSDGAAQMREAIVKAVAAPVSPPDQATHGAPDKKKLSELFAYPKAPLTFAEAIGQRAARGAVARMLERVFADFPAGLTITEIEGIADDYDKSVALKSIGNELRRGEGERYRRDEMNKWFLIGGDAEKETAGPDPAVNSSDGG